MNAHMLLMQPARGNTGPLQPLCCVRRRSVKAHHCSRCAAAEVKQSPRHDMATVAGKLLPRCSPQCIHMVTAATALCCCHCDPQDQTQM
jgi:hypothetical protein